MAFTQADITQLLIALGNGDEQVLNRLLPLVYDELHRIAASYVNRERPNHTLQPTALINEAFVRLLGQQEQAMDWQNRAHFYGIVARLMRQVLIDYARSYKAAKRSFGQQITLDESLDQAVQISVDLIVLDEALSQLAQFDEQKCRVVELRFFGGLTIDETAKVLNVSPATVEREWTVARAWLFNRLKLEQ